MKPVIGIPLRAIEDKKGRSAVYLVERVRESIIMSGGIAFAITPVQNVDYFRTSNKDIPVLTKEEKEQVEIYLNIIDALFIPGGFKITVFDRYLLTKAIERKIPILGVCLGMQLMANYKKEEIEIIMNNNDLHQQDNELKYQHKVTIKEDSKLYSIIGKKEIMVNSFHDRHIEHPNSEYKISAFSEDGLIEGIEYSTDTFHIGV